MDDLTHAHTRGIFPINASSDLFQNLTDLHGERIRLLLQQPAQRGATESAKGDTGKQALTHTSTSTSRAAP
jgi:hypothetical protein